MIISLSRACLFFLCSIPLSESQHDGREEENDLWQWAVDGGMDLSRVKLGYHPERGRGLFRRDGGNSSPDEPWFSMPGQLVISSRAAAASEPFRRGLNLDRDSDLSELHIQFSSLGVGFMTPCEVLVTFVAFVLAPITCGPVVGVTHGLNSSVSFRSIRTRHFSISKAAESQF